MKCKRCGQQKSKVLATLAEETAIKRTRVCDGCGEPFVTVEVCRDELYRVVRRFRSRERCGGCRSLAGDGEGCVVLKRRLDPLLCMVYRG
jgi:transcriptional regulator NrdR family protein